MWHMKTFFWEVERWSKLRSWELKVGLPHEWEKPCDLSHHFSQSALAGVRGRDRVGARYWIQEPLTACGHRDGHPFQPPAPCVVFLNGSQRVWRAVQLSTARPAEAGACSFYFCWCWAPPDILFLLLLLDPFWIFPRHDKSFTEKAIWMEFHFSPLISPKSLRKTWDLVSSAFHGRSPQ